MRHPARITEKWSGLDSPQTLPGEGSCTAGGREPSPMEHTEPEG